ncbi:S8 family serine peptidase [Cellulomonas sp. URHE0023]|uniref:S8 family peptidase n=1 Tax=Cellulomonas sp. URHE0023 TaxID=1380354 RepID=UPI00068BF234|nr:S8 family serine peptidase [Cellulomonas sp. URHE0023]
MSVFSDDPQTPGRPFGTDYASQQGAGDVDPRVQLQVRRQVDDLFQRHVDPSVRRRMNGTIRGRWSTRRGVELDALETSNGQETLVLGGELLVTARSWEDPAIRGYLARRRLERVEVGCPDLEDRLVRLVTTGTVRPGYLEDAVDELRRRGAAASLTHVTPLAGILKPHGTSVPTIGTFEEYGTHPTGDGSGAKVAVVDTGIDGTIRGDGWLTGIERRSDVPTTHADENNVDPLDNTPDDGFLDFSAGHGTFVSGVVAQVAPTADIEVYRALSTAGTGSEIEVACALIRAVRDGADVVNLSLGTQTQYDQPSLALAAALDVVREIEIARKREVLVVAAAGNFGDTTPVWPAAFRRVVSVGSLTADLRPSVFSSRGWWVDCSAIGEGILSPFVAGVQSPDFAPDPETFPEDAFARWSGTSFAAPQVAGAIARLMHERGLGAREAYVQLLASGNPLPDFGQTFTILPGV